MAKSLLTIAGYDPSSGAGVTADLQVMAAHGYFGMSAITALTVQSTVGVRAVSPVSTEILRMTLACLEDDLPIGGVKIGMLGSAENVSVVAEFVRGLKADVPVVLDTILRSSSGAELLDTDAVEVLKRELLPVVHWATPNRMELAALADGKAHQLLASTGLRGLVVTGGDEVKPDDLVLERGSDPVLLAGEKIESKATHGTGCAFSTALLCGLVEGKLGLEATHAAKEYVRQAILLAEPRGYGKGPLNLLWPLRS